MSYISFLHSLSFFTYLFLGIYIIIKDPKALLNRVSAALLLCFGLWSFGLIFIKNPGLSQNEITFYQNISSIGWIVFSSFALWTMLAFRNDKKILKSWLLYPALFIIPLILLYQQIVNNSIVKYNPGINVWVGKWSSTFWVYIFYCYYLIYLGAALFIIFIFIRKTNNIIKKKQAKIILITSIVSLLLGSTFDVILPHMNIHVPTLSDVFILIWALGIVYVIVKHKFLAITPAIAADNIISTMPGCLIMLDNEGKIISINHQTSNLTGYSEGKLKGHSIEILFRKEYKMIGLFEKILNGENFKNVDLLFKSKSGDDIPVNFSCSILYDSSGEKAGIICIASDMSEYKKKENEIRQTTKMQKNSEDKYRLLADNVSDNLWLLDVKTLKFIYNSPSVIRTIGYTQEESMNMSLEELLTPESLKNALSVLANEMNRDNDKGVDPDRVIVLETEQYHKYKDNVIIETTAKAIRDDEGKITTILGVSRDITERKKMQEELQNSEEKYRTIVEDIEDSYWEVDLAGNFTFSNSALQKNLGYTEDELLGMNYKKYMDNDNSEIVYKVFNIVYVSGAPAKLIRYEVIKKNGEKRIIEVSISPIHNSNKVITGFRGIARDVSERKKIEDDLKSSLEKLRKSLNGTVQAISLAVETRDPYTAGHQRRVSDLARTIACEMGISKDKVEGIRIAGILHDIGKISLPAGILTKPGRLTDPEFEIIKEHSKKGYDILDSIDFPWPVAEMVIQHHERNNGSGYPSGLTDKEILIEAKILAVADVVEAMATHRPYRPALGIELALEEIEKNKGALYEPNVVAACLIIFREKNYMFKE